MIAGPTGDRHARPDEEWDELWRPSRWGSQPEAPQPAGASFVAIVLLVLFANIVVNELLSPPWYVPFNLLVLAIVVLIARRSGTTWTAMGLGPGRLRRGLVIGGVIAVAMVIVIALAVTVPSARDAFRDRRIVEGSVALSMYHALFRIPLGTAVYEELLFRGVIFGMLARRTTAIWAAVWSSLLFGLWHVLPALDAIETNPIGDAFGVTWAPVTAAVVSTFVAGLVFVWIRLYAGSIVAPILVHVASNSTAVLASTFVVHVL